MIQKSDIAASARPLFAARDDLARRLAMTDRLLDNMARSYARADGVPFMRVQSFRQKVMGS